MMELQIKLLRAVLCSCLLSCPLTVPAEEPLPERVEFNRHIRPILSDKCFLCHGPDRNTREAGLRLDLRAEATLERDEHRAIAAGDAAASAMIQRIITDDPDDKMPPADSNRHVSPRELELLKRWIDQGAEYEPHWSYIKPESAPSPVVQNNAWGRNPIDKFILANLEKEGLKPAPEASRETLVRRLYFDLLGLPPTPAEVNAFLLDNSPNAYESLVERLLASPHFGERLAIYWLDLVRYADTVGYHGDQVRGVAPYRDYVIKAFNDNMPFDQFTREQIAGDLLPEPTEAQRIATGYNRLNMVTREGGAQEQDYVVRYAADRTRTTASVWLGSSLGCAQCHDHKFDPFTIQDFYRFGAFFADIKEMGVQNEGGNEGPFPPYLLFPNEQQKPEHDAVLKRIADLKAMLETPAPTDSVALASTNGAPVEAPAAPTREELEKQLSEATKHKFSLEQSIYSSAITETMEPRTTRVLPRGNWMDETGEVVGPGVPEFLGGMWQNGARPTRLDLANWLTDRENPLTARVFANRLWKLYFGTGISRVLDDLGSQGEWPKHPELLDYLAIEFMDSGWDIKHLARLIVTSSTYRQSSMADAALKELDPANRLLARQS
ncbi:MAG: PSD1 domain-containing protein, partial [Candidatus Hydrogenedentes bacterium]|nr:PSD1 domain-containing protein [Candidatus Hydrogenedentota bacterium]